MMRSLAHTCLILALFFGPSGEAFASGNVLWNVGRFPNTQPDGGGGATDIAMAELLRNATIAHMVLGHGPD